MPRRGIAPKAVIEGPPRRKCADPAAPDQLQGAGRADRFFRRDRTVGTHTARFGEIEQRGIALTRKGRALYDSCCRVRVKCRSTLEAAGPTTTVRTGRSLSRHSRTTRRPAPRRSSPSSAIRHARRQCRMRGWAARCPAIGLAGRAGSLMYRSDHVRGFPARQRRRYFPVEPRHGSPAELCDPPNREAFEDALGAKVQDELALYAERQAASLDMAMEKLSLSDLKLKTVA